MKMNTISKLAMFASLSLAAMSFAASKTAAPTTPAATATAAPTATTAPATTAPATAKAAKAMSFSGSVVSTDAIANTIVVKGAKGEETFSIAATGKITQGKKDVKLADITKDQKVTVKYTEEAGAKTASAVKVSAAAMKKEAKTSTAASTTTP